MMARFTALWIAAVMVVPGVASAQQTPTIPAVSTPPVAAQTAPGVPAVSSSQGTINSIGQTTGDVTYQYHLGLGDKVSVSVFGESDLGGTFVVSSEGKLSLPLIGDFPAAGMTAAELKSKIENAYRQGYLKDPKVTVDVMSFRPFYILGEVNKPGEYPYDSGMTVVNAVALASGFTYRADQKHVFIKHVNQLKETEVPLTTSQAVEPGDTIRISERYF